MKSEGMKRLIAGLLGLTLLAACGTTRAQSDQDRDGRKLADAIRTATASGGTFTLDSVLTVTGGDIPSGQMYRRQGTIGSGSLKGDTARFGYRMKEGSQVAQYQMLVVDGRLFVKTRPGAASQPMNPANPGAAQIPMTEWRATPLAAATILFPTLRLDLLREAVLLAASIGGGGLSHIDAGFARRYVVHPAPDQIEQLLAVPSDAAAAARFMKTATAEIDVYLLFPGDQLSRVEVHMTGTDPSNGQKQDITSRIDFHPGRVGAVQAPSDATLVSPSDVLT